MGEARDAVATWRGSDWYEEMLRVEKVGDSKAGNVFLCEQQELKITTE